MPKVTSLVILTLLVAKIVCGCSGGEAEQRQAQGNLPNYDVALPGHDLKDVRLIPNGGTYAVVFEIAKTIPYFCRTHGGASGVGESGVISVSEANQSISRIVNIVDGSALPDLTVSVGDTVTFVNMSASEHVLQTAD